RRSARHQLVQQREPLRPEFSVERVEAGQVASRPIEACNKPMLHGVATDAEYDWDAGSCRLSGESSHQSGWPDYGPSRFAQTTRQRWQSVSLVSRPAIFDHQVPAFYVGGFAQPPSEAGQPGGIGLRRPAV